MKIQLRNAIEKLRNFELDGIHYINIDSKYYVKEDEYITSELVVFDLLQFMNKRDSLVEITGDGLDNIGAKLRSM